MPSKKIKISELPLVESLKELYTIGYKIIDGIKTSVKVSLEDIQTAYQDVVNAVKNSEVATKNANTAASNANEKAVLADTAAANANDTAEHPTYIGQDHYVYKWNKTAQAYDKTDIYTKGDAFSIKKVYASVANMEADKSNPDITEGDFVLVNTGDVEDPDNAKLYVKADGDFEFLVDMSGAIGFTGKTPQFSIGTISTLEAGSTATATISEDGVDSDGNPKYKINFAIPRGNPGAPFRIAGEYATLEALKSSVPDGSAVDGFMAVGTEAPYDYYAWVNGDWVNQGKIAGGGSGNVVIVPIMGLTTQSTSDEIFNAFGGKQNLIDIIKKVKDEDCVVIAKTDDDPNAVLQQTFSVVNATYVNDNNLILGLISWSVNVTSQMIIQVIDGVASYNEISTPLMTEAPSDGNVYGRKNKGWVKVPEKSNVIILPKEILDLTGSSSSEEIFAAFGGIDKFKDLLEKLSTNNYLVQIGEPSLGSLRHIYTLVEYAVNLASNKQSGAISLNIYNEDRQLRRFHFYLENNGTTARCGEASTFQLVKDADVLTKTNTSSFTPTQPYHPATKKYVDEHDIQIWGIVPNLTLNNLTEQQKEKLIEIAESNKNLALTYYLSYEDNGNYIEEEYDAFATRYFYCQPGGSPEYYYTGIVFNGLTIVATLSLYLMIEDGVIYAFSNSVDLTRRKLVTSDNLTTITKKTAAEYEALGSKDANTAYCVTD
nr:MAG TPA: FIBRITIN T4, STRUCTURAL PROTEIN, CHAPERONE.85A [Bacteriophage sp.]